MSFVEKMSIVVIFLVGIVTMATAIIRSVSLESSNDGTSVSTTWLILVCSLTSCPTESITNSIVFSGALLRAQLVRTHHHNQTYIDIGF